MIANAKYLILFSSFLISSCAFLDYNTARFEIVNRSDEKIDSLRLYPAIAEPEYVFLLPFDSIAYNLNMRGIPPQDGSYKIVYKNGKGQEIVETFGYYSNGASQESKTIIEVYSDHISFDQIY